MKERRKIIEVYYTEDTQTAVCRFEIINKENSDLANSLMSFFNSAIEKEINKLREKNDS